MLIFSGLLLIPPRWNDEPNSPFPKKKEAIERYHNQYHQRSGPLLFCNHHVHLPNGLALRYGVTEPLLETSRTDAWVIAWSETLVVQCDAVIEGAGIGGHRPRVPRCAQELPDKLVLTDRLGARQLDRAIQRFRHRDVGHDVGDIIRHDGLHQGRRESNRLPLGCSLGNAAHELKELRGANDGVGNRRSLDKILLSQFRRGNSR